jgi:hypothetical protein
MIIIRRWTGIGSGEGENLGKQIVLGKVVY